MHKIRLSRGTLIVLIKIWLNYNCFDEDSPHLNIVLPAHMSRGRGSKGVGKEMGKWGSASALKIHFINFVNLCWHLYTDTLFNILICVLAWHFCWKFWIDEIGWWDVFWRVHHLIGRHPFSPNPRLFFTYSMQPTNSTGWGLRRGARLVKTFIADEHPSQRPDNMYSWMRRWGCYCIVVDIYI